MVGLCFFGGQTGTAKDTRSPDILIACASVRVNKVTLRKVKVAGVVPRVADAGNIGRQAGLANNTDVKPFPGEFGED
ncbi:hypothetical protein HG531_013550 [Fusarium graminearum]|nr:hypothetical protein HG531_013550 [Fusarium graminearum]